MLASLVGSKIFSVHPCRQTVLHSLENFTVRDQLAKRGMDKAKDCGKSNVCGILGNLVVFLFFAFCFWFLFYFLVSCKMHHCVES